MVGKKKNAVIAIISKNTSIRNIVQTLLEKNNYSHIRGIGLVYRHFKITKCLERANYIHHMLGNEYTILLRHNK